MAWFVPALAAVGGALVQAAPAIGTAASVGTGVYGAVQSSKKPPSPPDTAKKASLLAARLASGRTSRGETGLAGTRLTGGGGDLSTAPIGKRTLLGG